RVADVDDLVEDRPVIVAGHLPDPHPLQDGRTLGPGLARLEEAAVDGAAGVDGDDPRAPAPLADAALAGRLLRRLPQIAARAHDRPGGAHAGEKDVHLAARLLPDLGARRLVVRPRVGIVVELVRPDRARDLLREPLGALVVVIGIVPGLLLDEPHLGPEAAA